MKDQPPIDQLLWDGLPAEARAAVSALVAAYELRIAGLEQRLRGNPANSSRPPSSDPPSLNRQRPPAPPSGKGRGGPDTADTLAPRSRPSNSGRS